MLNSGTLHIYSADDKEYYGNIMFAHVYPMSEEEYYDFHRKVINEHFPQLKGKPLHFVWE